ncbi:MAG: glycosyltransferase family 4 protein, partial [Anaerolineae bacterium]|nr:glycosyltransferase family 4 protein [Anaerolineae bacterium]
GVDLILEALPAVCQAHPRVRLILFGRPVEPYRARAEALPGVVDLVDNEPFTRLPQYLAIADIALVPRLYGENVPGKLPIYMIAGKAIIGSDTTGINTVIEDGHTGLVIPPTVEALTTALNRLVGDPAFRAELARNVLVEANQRYHPDIIRAGMREAYQRVLRP